MLSTTFPIHHNSGIQPVSADDKEKKSVGIPNCRTIASTSFLNFSKYGGLFLKLLYI